MITPTPFPDGASESTYHTAINAYNAAAQLMVEEAISHLNGLVREAIPPARWFVTQGTFESSDDMAVPRLNITHVGLSDGEVLTAAGQTPDQWAEAYDDLMEIASEPLTWIAELTQDYHGIVRWSGDGRVWLTESELERLAP